VRGRQLTAGAVTQPNLIFHVDFIAGEVLHLLIIWATAGGVVVGLQIYASLNMHVFTEVAPILR
jgi:hypothetical protein